MSRTVLRFGYKVDIQHNRTPGGEPMTTNGDFWGLMGTKIHGDSRSNR